MQDHFNLFSIFSLFAGLSFFLFGMKFGEKGLRKISGAKLRHYISIITKNRVYGAIAGIIVTFLTQSSSATSVMLVGLTSAGLMTLVQATGILLGADIGSTLTIQLYAFKASDYAPFLIALGFFPFAFSTKAFRQHTGQIIMAFGMVFFGMKMMADSVVPLQQNRLFFEILKASISSPYLAIFVSAVFTAIFQSSAVTIAIVMAFAVSIPGAKEAMIPLDHAVPLILGANLGTAATALIASINTGVEGRRVAWAHTLFKVFGVLLFIPVIKLFTTLCQFTSIDPIRQIANAHSLFNVFMTLLFLPIIPFFVRMVLKLVPAKEKKEDAECSLIHYNKDIFHLPALALGQASREIVRMSGIVIQMMEDAITVFTRNNEELRRKLIETDNRVDFLQEAIVPFLSRLSREELTEEQSKQGIRLLAITAELEQAADVVSKHLMQHAKKKIEKGFLFSQEGWKEIKAFHSETLLHLQSAVTAFSMNDVALALDVMEKERYMESYLEKLRQSHMNRLHRGLPETLETTTVHLDLLDDLHLINIHAFRIAALVADKSRHGKAEPVL